MGMGMGMGVPNRRRRRPLHLRPADNHVNYLIIRSAITSTITYPVAA